MKRESTAIEKSKKPSDNIFTLMWHTREKIEWQVKWI